MDIHVGTSNSIIFHYISMYIVIVNAKLKIIGINTGITQV